MKNPLFLILTLVLSVSSIHAQNGDLPHVTRISVEARNNLIRLTWTDSPEARGPVYIFRSARPFTGVIPANIRPVVVRYGTQYYIDDTDDMGNLYYFIAASDVTGRRFDVIIPQTNSAQVNLSQPDSPMIAPPATALTEPIEGISNLKAVLDGEKVSVTYDNTNPQRNVILFRSNQPVRRASDLLNANIVESAFDGIVDYPVPGIAWYYALLYEDEIASGKIKIDPGLNATVSPVIVPTDITARAMRPIPLPVLSPQDHPNLIPLGAAGIDLLKNTRMPAKDRLELKKPRVFKVDLQAPSGGEESALFQIINDHFTLFEWESARAGLLHFLSLPRSKEVEARARFYLGQTFYFSGLFREALFEFLFFRSYNQVEANIWVDAVLAAMVH